MRDSSPVQHVQASLAVAFGRGIVRLLSGCMFAAAVAGCGPTSFVITPVPAERELKEYILERDSVWTERRIVLLDIDGLLRNQRSETLFGAGGENPVSMLKEKLDKAADDDRVRAVVLRINSPGGTVTSSDLMYTEVRRFRERSGKPVIASMMDVCASGGYYIACAADRIYAHPTSVTGSIGVIMIAPDVSGTMAKLGIQANVIKSGALKDSGSPLREMTDADRAVFESMIGQMYARFLDVVAAGRPGLTLDRIRTLADGRVYLAPQAREAGLIDDVGTLEDAVAAAKQAAKIDGRPVVLVQYGRPLAHRPNVYARGGDTPAQVNLINIELPAMLTNGGPEFLYLWAPSW